MSSTTQTGYVHSAAFDAGYLPVSALHRIHYEQYGNKEGKPVIFLHGGPGGSTSIAHTVFFNPSIYRVVLFDQRGAGRSLPSGELTENTSTHLVADIEALRTHLGIAKWHLVFGGSWGSTLSLLYAQAHPDVVGALLLRGVFFGTAEELQFSRGRTGAARIRPEDYDRWVGYLPEEDRGQPLQGYHKLLTHPDAKVQRDAGVAYARWGVAFAKLAPEADLAAFDEAVEKGEKEHRERHWAHSRIECHYHLHCDFLEDGQILREENLARIRHIPCSIVQGRYDIVCTPRSAWELHRRLPESRLFWVGDAGHNQFEPGIQAKLLEMCDEYAQMDF